jgi:hypothetical protein
MYHLIPYRSSLPEDISPTQAREKLSQLAERTLIQLDMSRPALPHVVRSEEQGEWLAPEMRVVLPPQESAEVKRLVLRPKRWLRVIFRLEMASLLGLLLWLGIEQHLTPFVLILGLVSINHFFIFLMMRARFRQSAAWLSDQLIR